MATTFYHNGNYFEIIEGTEEVILRRSGEISGDVILPKYAMYNGQRYTVTEIGRPGDWPYYKYENVNAGDKRKKEDWEYVKKGSGCTSVFCKDKAYPTYSDLKPEIPITQLVIPDSVKIIHNYAFYNCKNLVSLTIPDSVTTIGDAAFRYCTSLKSLTIPDSVTEIGNAAFCGCTSLKSLIIPDSVTSIGATAFAFACGLESLRLSSNVKRLSSSLFGWGAFHGISDQRWVQTNVTLIP